MTKCKSSQLCYKPESQKLQCQQHFIFKFDILNLPALSAQLANWNTCTAHRGPLSFSNFQFVSSMLAVYNKHSKVLQFELATLPHLLGKYGHCDQSVIDISEVLVEIFMTQDNKMKTMALYCSICSSISPKTNGHNIHSPCSS